MTDIAHVAIPGTKHPYFDYRVPQGAKVVPAQRVLVPLGRRVCVGIVVAMTDHSPHAQLKPLCLDPNYEVILDDALWDLVQWMARYYHVFIGDMLQILWPSLLRHTDFTDPWLRQCFVCTELGLGILTKRKPSQAQRTLLEHCHHPTMGMVLKEAGMGRRTLESCLKAGWLERCMERPQKEPAVALDCQLNSDQDQAAYAIGMHEGFGVHVLHGVTGSGKTEVYCQAILACLQRGQSALVLVPEIGLTEQTVARFQRRCGVVPCVLHSNLSDEARWAHWSALHQGTVRLCIGTRSAILAPMQNLGLIVIDEEHDASYKQHSGVRYHARDVAVMRAKGLGISVVLGSATPSLETLYNIEQQRYQCLRLAKRAVPGGQVSYHIVDIRGQKLESGISASAQQAMHVHLERGEQVLVFINRRGFAPVLLCHSCGHTTDCPSCDAHLAWHTFDRMLHCHHCGYQSSRPPQCPSCGAVDWVEVGVGTQRLEEAIEQLFPKAVLVRIDRDSTQKKGALDDKLDAVHQGHAQILIGTQMIAKGHDFDNIGLVVLVEVDSQLYHPDFRATEQFAQLLVQVAGRSGRRGQKASVLLQTHHPNHPHLLSLLKDGYETLAKTLLAERKVAHLPPFQRHAMLHIQSHKPELIGLALQALQGPLAWHYEGVDVLGPMPAVMRKKGGYIQYQVIFSSHTQRDLHACLHAWQSFCRQETLFLKLRWWLDVDPIGM